MKQTELKPCPFCGRKANIYITGKGIQSDAFTVDYEVGCGECRIRFKGTTYILMHGEEPMVSVDGYKECIELWNRRADHEQRKQIEAEAFDYYVVRHKETGQYFRGKGVNKWGKYFNQASIYRFNAHAENAVEEETRRGNPTEVVKIRIEEVKSNLDSYKPDEDVIIQEERKFIQAAIQEECARYSDCDECPHTDGFCNYYLSSTAPIEILRSWYEEMFGKKKDGE